MNDTTSNETSSPAISPEQMAAYVEEIRPLSATPGMLMQALHIAQTRFGHIPPDVQEVIAKTLDVPMSTVYGVITFYSNFTLDPKGRVEISICMGTACYIQGSSKLLQEAEKKLGVGPDETTPDGMFTLSTTRCLGACGLAPVVTVNGEVHGRMARPDQIIELIDRLAEEA